MATNYAQLAQDIVRLVGGEGNVNSLTHCITRLRFILKDTGKANEEELKKLDILGVQFQGGQYQVIVGNDVSRVYKEITKQYASISAGGEVPDDDAKKEGNVLSRLMATLSSILVAPLAPIIGGGMIMGITFLLGQLGIIDTKGSIYTLLNSVGNCTMYFFPFLLAVSAAKKFNTNIYMAMGIAASMMHPYISTALGFATKEAAYVAEPLMFGPVPLPMINYANSVLPIIIAVWFMSKVYNYFDEKLPAMVTVIFAPVLTFLIVVPVNMIVIAPLSTYLSSYLGNGLEYLISAAPALAGFVIGGTRPLLILVGMHHAIRPLQYMQIENFGYTTITPSNFLSTMAQATAALACNFLVKGEKNKQVAMSSTISGYLGITEPALYGLIFKYKAALVGTLVGGGLGSMVATMMGAKAYASGMPSILTIPIFMGGGVAPIVVGLAVMFVATFGLTFVLGKTVFPFDDNVVLTDGKAEKAASKKKGKQVNTSAAVDVLSPASGEVVDITTVSDQTFASKVLGEGIAIAPKDGKIVAPANGKITTLFQTHHAIGFTCDNGVEVLIHIGIDTVKLEGKHFTALCKEGQQVKQGDALIEFDKAALEAEGFDTTVLVVITNSGDYGSVSCEFTSGAIFAGEKLLHIVSKAVANV